MQVSPQPPTTEPVMEKENLTRIAVIPDFRITYYVAPILGVVLYIACRISNKKQAQKAGNPEAPAEKAD